MKERLDKIFDAARSYKKRLGIGIDTILVLLSLCLAYLIRLGSIDEIVAYMRDKKPRWIPPSDSKVARYIKTVTNGSRFRLAKLFRKSYLPMVPLPHDSNEAMRILERIYELHNHGRYCGGENAFKYLMGEIVDNVYEHSEFTDSFVIAQKYINRGFMDVCFFDNGITINGSFRKHGEPFESDSLAIGEALNGASTKGDERGYGLNTTARIYTEGIAGKILIVSGNGAVECYNQQQQSYQFGKAYQLEGTLVSVRMPYPAKEVNIYDFIA